MSEKQDQYFYIWKPDDSRYDSQEELHDKHPEACEEGKHDWRTTWVFGIYDCNKCQARREVR